MNDLPPLDLLRLLLARLERISADSVWAHRASGVRGSLLRMMVQLEKNHPVNTIELNRLAEMGFFILEESAKEKF
jgi:hypothetical protein